MQNNKKKILLIEDEQQLRENITELLELNGYDVLPVDAGDKAMQFISIYKPDLILCDIKMPRYDGYWVLNETRKLNPTGKVPFIFISAKVDRADVRTGMDLGADDYLTKPFSAEELLSAVNARLSRVADQESTNYGDGEDTPKAKAEDLNVLTPTEKRIIYQIAQNSTSSEISKKFFISLKTVENHRSNITNKMGLKGHLSLLRFCLNNKKLILSQNWD
jgi:DNA-binding NarL/FixJ family response regulator